MSAPDRELLLIRHGETDWNRRGLIQGRRDVPLSGAGRRALAACRVPQPWRGGDWHASPLRRAVDSARALGADTLKLAPALQEMDWGDWEGRTLASLRDELGDALRDNEARGLDFRPAGGESPREVRERLRGWLAALAPGDRPLVAVTHKGVIRAALSLATGWDMREDFRPKPDWRCGHAFRIDAGAGLHLVRPDVALEAAR